jgi:hypothetical protein
MHKIDFNATNRQFCVCEREKSKWKMKFELQQKTFLCIEIIFIDRKIVEFVKRERE